MVHTRISSIFTAFVAIRDPGSCPEAARPQKRDTEPGIWRFVTGALATFFLCFLKTFGSKKRVRHGISLRSIKKEIQNRLKTKKVRSSQSWSSKIFIFFENFEIFENFENFFRNHDFSIFKGFS